MRPVRIQRKRTKGWKMPENTVYVGRPSKFGNPFADWRDPAGNIGNKLYEVMLFKLWLGEFGLDIHWLRNALCADKQPELAQYRIDLLNRQRKTILSHLHELRGKNLACWCPWEQICHADVLLVLANKDGGK